VRRGAAISTPSRRSLNDQHGPGNRPGLPPNTGEETRYLGTCETRSVETMPVEVVGPDARELWRFNAISYKVRADGTLDIDLPDGSRRHFEVHEWIDVRNPDE
jgi:hypothetical protein